MESPSLQMQMFSSIKVLESQQKDIKEAVKGLEGAVDRLLPDQSRIADMEAALEKMGENRRNWVTWAVQIVGQILITTALVILGGKLGVTVSW